MLLNFQLCIFSHHPINEQSQSTIFSDFFFLTVCNLTLMSTPHFTIEMYFYEYTLSSLSPGQTARKMFSFLLNFFKFFFKFSFLCSFQTNVFFSKTILGKGSHANVTKISFQSTLQYCVCRLGPSRWRRVSSTGRRATSCSRRTRPRRPYSSTTSPSPTAPTPAWRSSARGRNRTGSRRSSSPIRGVVGKNIRLINGSVKTNFASKAFQCDFNEIIFKMTFG